MFTSDTARIILDNGTFEVNNFYQPVYFGYYVLDTTVTLSVGTLIARGSSFLKTDCSFNPQGRASLRLGDGIAAAADLNIIVDPGATLNLVATDINCSVIVQNVH
jgi:hypothetical protein